MRSPVGTTLIVLSLATAVVLVLLLVQTIGMRGALETARSQVGAIEQQVAEQKNGASTTELSSRLSALEREIRELIADIDVAPTRVPSVPGDNDEVLERLDEVLDRIGALDDRVDAICENVPVC